MSDGSLRTVLKTEGVSGLQCTPSPRNQIPNGSLYDTGPEVSRNRANTSLSLLKLIGKEVADQTDPLNAYGRSKARGEELLEQSGARWYNIRTSWLYAPWGKNFVKTIAGLLKTKPSIKVVNDQRGRPTSAEHLASTTLQLMDVDAHPGTWHVTDGGECTWFEFAGQIRSLLAARGEQVGEVLPCSSDEFPRPAKRPAYSVLDISATKAAVGEVPDWTANLAAVVKRLDR